MDDISDLYEKSVLVLGCGNTLFGDDGFGPAVADYISANCKIPQDAAVVNVGNSVRGILFNVMLSEKKPRMIIIVDAVDFGRDPGDVFEIKPDEIPLKKIDDFSMHQMPTSNLLRELKELCNVDVRLIVCQVSTIPDLVNVGLSEVVQKSVEKAAGMILGLIGNI